MYEAKFSFAGYDVLTAYNGEDGLKKAIEQRPNVILLDMMLPKMTGDILVQKLHDNASTSTIPIVVLTNLAQKVKARQMEDLGVKEYLAKAMFTPEQIIEKVKKYTS